MSIQLPRSLRELHFTGSVKALAPERPTPALGRDRPKQPPPLPRSQPASAGAASAASARPARAPVKKLPTMRGPIVSIDEEAEVNTQSLDRDEIHAALFPIARRAPASRPAPNLPVPHFRSAAAVRAHHVEPTIIVRRAAPEPTTLPLGLWLIAAMIAAIVSYHFAPQAMGDVAEAVRALSAR